MPQPLQVTFCALHSFICCLLKDSPHRKHFLLDFVGLVEEPVEELELEFCSLEGFLDFLLLLLYA